MRQVKPSISAAWKGHKGKWEGVRDGEGVEQEGVKEEGVEGSGEKEIERMEKRR